MRHTGRPHNIDHRGTGISGLTTGTLLAAFLVAGAMTPVHAAVTMVADFNEGANPLDVGTGSSVSVFGGGNVTASYAATASTQPALGNRGSSLKVSFTTGSDGGVVLNFGSSIDVSTYAALSLWVRGAAGAERMQVSLKRATSSNEPGFRPDVRNFLPAGVTTSWQKVVIPIRALMSDFLVNTSTALSDINAVVFTIASAVPTETFYVDDVLFHTRAGQVWVDDFNDGAEPGAFGHNSGNFVVTGEANSSLAHVYTTGVSSSPPAAFQITWTTGTNVTITTNAAVQLIMDSNRNSAAAVDVTGCDTLALSVMGDSAASGRPLGIGISDDAFNEKIHATTVTLSTSWQAVTRSFADFALPSSTNIAQVQFWFLNDSAGRGPGVGNNVSQVVYVDDVRFLDTVAPTAPSALQDDGTAVPNGTLFGPTNAVTFTAPTSSADATLESVRVEHDNQTGGASWYVVYQNTNTSSASHSFTWETAGLAIGSSYRLRAVSMDSAGNEAATTFTGIEVNSCNGIAQAGDVTAPTVTHTAVSTATAGTALPIAVSATDDFRIDGATLFYRAKGASAYVSLPYSLSDPCSSSFSGSVSIPASSVTSAGLEYYVTATDSRNTGSFASASDPRSVLVKETEKETEVGSGGGTVTLEDSNPNDGATSVVIPEGALDSDVAVTIVRKDVTTTPNGAVAGRDRPFAAFEFGPSGQKFRKPVRITLLYPDADQDGRLEDATTGQNSASSETDLRVFVHDGFDWRDLGGTVDAALNTVTAQTSHFSTFGVFPGGAASKEKIRPPQKIITPGGSPGVNDTLDFGGAATGARIDLFDVRGRRVRRLEDRLSWDGRDDEGRIVESGVYLYEAEVEGIKISGTVTVAR